MTSDEIARWQLTRRDHLGLPLKADGVLGPATEWAMAFETLSRGRRAIVTTAQTFLGLEEEPRGSNDEPSGMIRQWLGRAGAQPGDPWCAAFASRCLGSVRIASARELGKAFPPTSSLRAGDLMWYPTSAEHGHCGIVIGASDTEVMTIEGNSDNAVRCVRRSRAGLRFARTLPDATGRCPPVVPSVKLAGGVTR